MRISALTRSILRRSITYTIVCPKTIDKERNPFVGFLFSLRPHVRRSCFLIQPRAILARRMCLHRRRNNCAPVEHHFHFCTGGAQVVVKLLHQRRRSCQLPIRWRGSSTYVPMAHKFWLSASVVVSLARLRLRLGRFRLCVFEFGFFFRIEKILALQLFAAHFFFGFYHFTHHT